MQRKFVFLLLLLPLMASAQRQGQARIDSMLNDLPRMKEDKAKVNTLFLLSGSYNRIDADKALKYGMMAVQLARKLNFPAGECRALNNVGLAYFVKADYTRALAYYDSGYTVSVQVGDKKISNLELMNKGSVYGLQGYYYKAIDVYLQCLKTTEELGDKRNEVLCLSNLGSAYNKISEDEKGLDYAQRSYALYVDLKDTNGIARSLVNEADAYDVLGQRSKALDCYQNAQVLFQSIGDREGVAGAMIDRGMTYEESKDYKEAIGEYTKAASISESIGDMYQLGTLYNNLANSYMDAAGSVSVEQPGLKSTYLRLADSALAKAIVINTKNGNLDALTFNYKYLAQLDSVKGNYKAAMSAYEQYSIFNDSIVNNANKSSLQKAEDQREIDLRDKQIQINRLEIHNERTQRWFYIAGLFVLFLIGSLLFWQNRQRKRVNRRLQSLNAQLDEANKIKVRLLGIMSHDLRSPISALINFLRLRKEQPEISVADMDRYENNITVGAENLLHTMEDLLFWSKGQMKNFNPQSRQVIIADVFSEMRLLYPDEEHLRLQFEDPEGLRLVTDINYLKAILRNLTTNAIKAVKNDADGRIAWRAWQEEGKGFLSISDNGPGMTEAGRQSLFGDESSSAVGDGFGLHLVRDFALAIGVIITLSSDSDNKTVLTLRFGK